MNSPIYIKRLETLLNVWFFWVSMLCAILLTFLVTANLSGQSDSIGDMVYKPLLGEQKMLFIRAKYPDKNKVVLTNDRAPFHVQAIKRIMKENSYGKFGFAIDVTPVLTLPQPMEFYRHHSKLSFVRLRADAIKMAEDAGYLEKDYDRECIFINNVWFLPFRGIGGINLRTVITAYDKPSHTSHEIGHTFDWRHASFWRVEGSDPIAEDGELDEYGDKFDFMGDFENYHHYNPWYKYRAGWIPSKNVLQVQKSGNYVVKALEIAPTVGDTIQAYSALRIRRSPDSEYWVYYRRDENLANTGALISKIVPQNSVRTLLLDMTPGSKGPKQDYKDAALTEGNTFKDEEAGISITLLKKNKNALVIKVVVPDVPIDILPVLDIIKPEAGITQSNFVEYEVTAYDPNVEQINGAGIDTVRLFLGYFEGDDPFGEGLTFIPMAQKEWTKPPYSVRVNTKDFPDEVYRVFTEAIASDGGRNLAVLNHIIDNTGPSIKTSVVNQARNTSPVTWIQNFPNPFNESTTIQYYIDRPGQVTLNIYNSLGRKIKTLIHEAQNEGFHHYIWNARDDSGQQVPNGVYLYEMRLDQWIVVKKMQFVQ